MTTLRESVSIDPPLETLDSGTVSGAQWLVLGAAFLGWMFDGVEIGLFPLVVRPALQSLGLADDSAIAYWNSIMVAAFLLGAASGGIVFGWLGDKLGRVRTMAVAILIYSLFTGACALAQAPWQLGLFRFIASLGMGGEWALAVALVMECWPERHRPRLAGAIGSAANFGFLFIAVVALVKPVSQDSWRWMMLVGAAPAVLALAVIMFVPESERWKQSVRAAKQRGGPSSPGLRLSDFSTSAAFLVPFGLSFALIFSVLVWTRSASFLETVAAESWFGWLAARLVGLLVIFSVSWAGMFAARRTAWFVPLVLLAVAHATAAWLYRESYAVIALTIAFLAGSLGAAGTVQEIFSPGLRKRTFMAVIFSGVPLIGTWAAVSGWIPVWVDQMSQAEAGRAMLGPVAAAEFDKAPDPKRKLQILDAELNDAQWQDVRHSTARSKAWVQMVLAIGAIAGCFVAPILGGLWGRRPVYFTLCLTSLLSCAYLFRYLDSYNLWFTLVVGFVGFVTAAFYGWLPLYLPELFPTRVRATGQGLSFNFGRILAALGTFYMGYLVALFGGDYGKAMAGITLIYLVGMVMIWFAPETKGKPLPE